MSISPLSAIDLHISSCLQQQRKKCALDHKIFLVLDMKNMQWSKQLSYLLEKQATAWLSFGVKNNTNRIIQRVNGGAFTLSVHCKRYHVSL